MKKKINVGLLFGGKSFEHEISLLSAQSVYSVIDREKYNITLLGIDKEGNWHFLEEGKHFLNADSPERIALGSSDGLIDAFTLRESRKIDVIFPILHGPNGEDGTVQGLLKLIDIPYVGPDILGSSIGMDKDVSKRLLREAGIPLAKFITIHAHEKNLWPPERILEEMPFPLFVKPANAGSSVGISKAKNLLEFEKAIDIAFRYDRKIIVEETIEGTDVQCSIMGNEDPIASLPCQIVPIGEFHSYTSKYLDKGAAKFFIPANISEEEMKLAQELSLKAYKTLCCEGMARIDLLRSSDGEIFVSEINTIPGLTEISPYTKMWDASGIDYRELIDRLIEYALARYERDKRLVTVIDPKEKWVAHHV